MSIGYLSDDRLSSIPLTIQPLHELCFYIHDLMYSLMADGEDSGFHTLEIKLTENDKKILSETIDAMDFFRKSGRYEDAKRIALSNISLAIYADMLHFIKYALYAFEQRQFTVAFSLLRKPFREGLLLASFLYAAPDIFYQGFRENPSSLLNVTGFPLDQQKKIIQNAIEKMPDPAFVDPDILVSMVTDRGSANGLARLFDMASHYTTNFKPIRTIADDLNFIFTDYRDDELFVSQYKLIPPVLMYLFYLQLEIYRSFGFEKRYYEQNAKLRVMAIYSCVGLSNRSPFVGAVNRHMGDLMVCPVCGKSNKMTKKQLPKTILSGSMACTECGSLFESPIGWMFSRGYFKLKN